MTPTVSRKLAAAIERGENRAARIQPAPAKQETTVTDNIVIERDDANDYMRAVLTINGIKRGEAYRSGSDEWTFTPYRVNGNRISPVLVLCKTYKTEAGAMKKLRQHEADMLKAAQS